MRSPHVCPTLVALLLFGNACNSGDESEARSSRPPNVVAILADDQGWGDLSLHGNTNLSTPNIDSLAHDGAQFKHFYVCSSCAPTRAEFLTGRYFARGGVRGVSTGLERLNIDEHTIAQTFRQAGYATAAFGKWHNGTQHPYHPNARGFDEFYGFTEGHWGHYFDYELDHNGELVTGEGFVIDDVTNRALDFMEQKRDQPFFAYLAYNTPHSPMQVPDEYWERFETKELAMRHREPDEEDAPKTRSALAMVENIDWNVGRVLQKLDELELSGDTIIFYFTDNGPNGARWNGGMKGRKGSVDEGGLRSPLLLRWTGKVPAGLAVEQIAGAIDLLPTLAELAGIEVGGEKPLDGRSLKPLLLGEDTPWAERMLYSLRTARGSILVSVRDQRFRLDPEGQLFDIAADPGQREDVSGQYPGRDRQAPSGGSSVGRRSGAVCRTGREAVSGRPLRNDAVAGPRRRSAWQCPAQRTGSQLFVLHGIGRVRMTRSRGTSRLPKPGNTRSRSTTRLAKPARRSRHPSRVQLSPGRFRRSTIRRHMAPKPTACRAGANPWSRTSGRCPSARSNCRRRVGA